MLRRVCVCLCGVCLCCVCVHLCVSSDLFFLLDGGWTPLMYRVDGGARVSGGGLNVCLRTRDI